MEIEIQYLLRVPVLTTEMSLERIGLPQGKISGAPYVAMRRLLVSQG
jgi:hypothetical protein